MGNIQEEYRHRVQHLRGTADEWKQYGSNIIPLAGELVIEFDDTGDNLHKLKIGDGVTPYNQLPYSNPQNSGLYTNTTPLISDLGGILAENHPNGFTDVPVNDIITELLYPYMPPQISNFSLDPSDGVYPKNEPLHDISANFTVEKRSKDINFIGLYKRLHSTNEVSEIAHYEYNDQHPYSDKAFEVSIETLPSIRDVSFYVIAKDIDGKITQSEDQTYNFVYPYFYGVVEKSTEITSATLISLTKKIRAQGSHSYSYTTNNNCPLIAYPATYGELKSIIDPNNFTQDWTLSMVTVNNNSTISGVDYYVYVGGVSTATDIEYKFNY